MVYMPGHVSDEHESWYINMGIVTKCFSIRIGWSAWGIASHGIHRCGKNN